MIRDMVAVYKEEGMTSHGVVNALRKLTGKKRIGHAGTLDPYAKGVLVVGIGRAATKQLRQVAGTDKEYVTRIRLGMRSTTDDREGRIEEAHVPQIPSEDEVRRALRRFTGIIPQRPPIYSAVKVGGRAAYKLARAKRHIELQVRQVEAKEIELLEYSWPRVRVRLVTGPGFYVRSFARDLGEALGTGGYVEELERIRVGTYTKEQAVHLSELAKRAKDP
jgi:tRNA pseudouridine55 synthase